MRRLRAFFTRLSALFKKSRIDQELSAEVESHLQMHIDDNIRSGMTPEEARRQALIKLGGIEPVKENCRRCNGIPMLEIFFQDVRYSVRSLLKSHISTAVIVLTLALGIGGNAAIFSLVRTVLLQPLPFYQPKRLIGIRETKVGEGHNNPLAWLSFFEIRDKARTLESVAAYFNRDFDIERGDGVVRVAGARVSYTYFQVLGVHPLLGRDFGPDDDKYGAQPTAILSYELWQEMYGGDKEIIGRSVRIDNADYAIIGVAPPIGDNGLGGQIGWRRMWSPFRANESGARLNPGRSLRVNARLKPGVTLQHASAELEALIDGLRISSPTTHSKEIGIYATPLNDYVVDPNAQQALWVLFGAVFFVLLIACANVANLLLARSADREKEIAVRLALGASNSSIIRRLLTESLILSIVGAGLGWMLARWAISLSARFLPDALQRRGSIQLDGWVFGFTLFLSVGAGLLFGLVPALGATKVKLTDALKSGSGSMTAAPRRQRFRSLLVVAEIGLAVVLLVGSGLLLESFGRLTHVELGFNPDNVLTMRLSLPVDRYRDPNARVNFYKQTLSKIEQIPGVQSAAICFSLLMTGEGATDRVVVEGRPPVPKGEEPVLRGGSVSADYFKTMGIPFRKGRSFTEQEVWQGSYVVIVNEAFANRFFPNEDPIGKRIKVGENPSIPDPPYVTIVGVVANHIQPGVDNRIWEEMFYPYVNTADPPLWQMNLVVKTSTDLGVMTKDIVDQAKGLDRLVPVTRVVTVRELTHNALKNDRFNTWLLASFALLAMLLAVLGLYGVISYSTSQRTSEIGIRIALGAESGDILRLVVGQGMMLVVAGVAIGLVAGLAVTRALSSLLFEVSSTDPTAFIAVPLVLSVVAFLACYIPAKRAAKLDPMIALKYE